jgi:hypothetical protein
VWAHSFTLSRTLKNVNVSPKLHSWPTPFHALCFSHEPKVKVMTNIYFGYQNKVYVINKQLIINVFGVYAEGYMKDLKG